MDCPTFFSPIYERMYTVNSMFNVFTPNLQGRAIKVFSKQVVSFIYNEHKYSKFSGYM